MYDDPTYREENLNREMVFILLFPVPGMHSVAFL